MSEQTLTICIPSYDRPNQVMRTIKQILPQIRGNNINIFVLDNASPDSYTTVFSKDQQLSKAIDSGTLEIRCNPSNIGMAANFLRGFEDACSDWLWLLSDDDDVQTNAIKNVFNAIENIEEEIGFIKFSSSRSRPVSNRVSIDTIEQFIDYNFRTTNDFNGFIFISNGIYRVDSFKSLINIGYQHAHTYVPHFLMMTEFMAQGGRMVVMQDEIVKYVIPQIGYSYGLLAGLGVGAPKSLLIDLTPKYANRFYALFFPHNDYKVIIDLYFHCKRDASKSVYQYHARNYIYLSSNARTWAQTLLLRIFVFLSYMPPIFEQMIRTMESRSSLLRRQISEIKMRYMDFEE